MKKIQTILAVSFFLMGVLSCQSLKDLDPTGMAQNISPDTVTSVVGTVGGGVDFKSGEVLSADCDNEKMTDCHYYAAKVVTPATPATKDQAEVLFVSGEQKWTPYVIPSHKTAKAELATGKYLLYHSSGNNDDLNQDAYRKHAWYLGKVTSTDELFKGLVEVSGHKIYLKWLRTPDRVIK